MKICLDTSSILEIIYATYKGEEILKIVDGKSVLVTAFTIHEILVGLKKTEVESIEKFLSGIFVVNFTKESATYSSIIEKHLREKGKLINKMDILIAGVCLHKNYHLISCDKDFEKIKGIQKTIV
jgi:predicted nucleic acid-binding protein